jgi:hypothetical protein
MILFVRFYTVVRGFIWHSTLNGLESNLSFCSTGHLKAWSIFGGTIKAVAAISSSSFAMGLNLLPAQLK